MELGGPADSVFQYSDFRTFLNDHIQRKKLRNPSWSCGAWARTLGLKNTASISRILMGGRSPGPEITQRLVRYFEFSPQEKSYFEGLVLLAKSKGDPTLSVLLMERLRELTPKRSFTLLNHDTFLAISNWWFYAIREMVRLENFREDPQWIAETLRFKVSAKEVRHALHVLIRLGLLKRESKSGKLIQGNPDVETQNDIACEGSKRNHEQNLDNAKWAVRNLSIHEREFNSVCLNISSHKFVEAKRLIREFEDRFIDLLEAPRNQGDLTCQLQIQFFPFTHSTQTKEKK